MRATGKEAKALKEDEVDRVVARNVAEAEADEGFLVNGHRSTFWNDDHLFAETRRIAELPDPRYS